MEKTKNQNHDEGDADWVKDRLKTYRLSEVRLVEIQEKVCNGVILGEGQCRALAEELEHTIEEWWTIQDDYPDLHNWLCVEKTTVCCPPNHFGSNCTECPDCYGNGVCRGNGTRKGSGRCKCEKGYGGDACNKCALQFYESFRDENKLLCSPCSNACRKDSGCTGAGPKGWYLVLCNCVWRTFAK